MSLLSQEKWKENNRRVSIPLPTRASNYLTLYSIAKGTTKAKLIRNLLDEFIVTEKKSERNETKLLSEIADRYSMRWKIEKTNKVLTFLEYKAKAREELEDKGVDHTHISLIIMQIKN